MRLAQEELEGHACCSPMQMEVTATCSLTFCIGNKSRQHVAMCYDSVHIISDTHALVRFSEDERTAIVPVARIVKKNDQIEYNGSCRVKWSNMKTYHAFSSGGTGGSCMLFTNANGGNCHLFIDVLHREQIQTGLPLSLT